MVGTVLRMNVFPSDPVTIKELTGLSRRWPMYFTRVLYVGLIGAVVWQFWHTTIGPRSSFSLSEYADLSRKLFHDFVQLQLAFVTLTALVSAAESLPRESRGGMMDLLSLTPLTSGEIILGKWKAVMAQAGFLILCGLPVVAICVYLGGVGLWEMAWSLSLTVALASVAAALALRASIRAGTMTAAIFRSMVRLGLWTLLAGVVAETLGTAVASYLHPLYAVPGASAHSITLESFGWVGIAALYSLWTLKLLRQADQELEVKAFEARRDPLPGNAFAGSDRFAQMLFLQGFRLDAPRRVWERFPLLWKELTTRAAARGIHLMRTPLIAVFAFGVCMAWISGEGTDRRTLYGLGGVFLLLAVLNGASLFAPDKQGGKWEMLLVTPIPGWEIIGAKLVAGLIATETLTLAGLGLAATTAWTFWGGPLSVALFLYTGALFLGFGYVLAAAASLRARTVRGAAAFALAVLLLLLQGSSLLPSAVAEWIHPVRLLESFMRRPISGAAALHLDLADPMGNLLFFSEIYGSATLVLLLWMVHSAARILGRRG